MYRKKGQLFVISAPSGTGKTTLSSKLLGEFNNISYSVSYTTRPPRSHEQNGREYYFVSVDEFKQMVDAGDFLEYAIVHGNFYGTSRKTIEENLALGKDILLDIDTQGAMQLKEALKYGVYIFIAPPSLDVLRKRLENRKDTKDIELRMKNARYELATFSKYTYLIINDDLAEAYRTFASIYLAEKSKVELIMDEIKF